jgi:hypothetical protein
MPGGGSVRHRPGPGLLMGAIGVLLMVLSLTALPWVSAGGEDATFSDIRDAFDAVDDYYGAGAVTAGPALPRVQQQELPPVGEPAPVPTPTAVDPPSNDFIEIYADMGWIVELAILVMAVVFATWLVPASKSGRMVTGFITAGIVGLAVNAADNEGSVGPRVCGALAALMGIGLHAFALLDLFGDEYAPDPAWGVWAGVLGLLLVLTGCCMGTRVERGPAYR